MSNAKINKSELVSLFAKQTKITLADSEKYLDSIQDSILDGLITDKIVKISGLGTFKLIWVEPRKSVNIQTGQEFVIEGHYKVGFAADNTLKEKLNNPIIQEEKENIENNVNMSEEEKEEDMGLSKTALEKLAIQAAAINEQLKEFQEMSAFSAEEETNSTEDNYSSEDETDSKTEVEVDEKENEVTINNEDSIKETETTETETVVNYNNTTENVTTEQSEIEETINESEVIPKEEDVTVTTFEETNKTFESIETGSNMNTQQHENQSENPYSFNNSTESTQSEGSFSNQYSADEFLIGSKPEKSNKTLIVTILLVIIVAAIGCLGYLYFDQVKETSISLYSKAINLFEKNGVNEVVIVEDNVDPVITEETVISQESQVEVESDPINEAMTQWSEPKVKTALVTEGSRLSHLAKKFYGHYSFWVYIYEANSDIIKDANNVMIGTVVIIPDMPKSIVNPKDDKCIEKALVLEDKILKGKFQPKAYLAKVAVNKGSRLSQLAKKYYGHSSLWVYIYEANRASIKNPNDIKAGTIVTIPAIPLSKRNPEDPESLRIAQELEREYLNQ